MDNIFILKILILYERLKHIPTKQFLKKQWIN